MTFPRFQLLALALCVPSQAAVHEAVVRGFPVLRTLAGEKLADGSFAQWLDGDALTATLDYDFPDGRRVEETAVFKLHPKLSQESWSWKETRGQVVLRQFSADLRTGLARSSIWDGTKMKRYEATLKLEPGKVFCGLGFNNAIESLLPRFDAGEKVSLTAVVFMPKPKAAQVEIVDLGVDRMRQGGLDRSGRHFRIRAKLPGFVRKLAGVSDYDIWLTDPPPAGFLRVEGPLAQPKDASVRVDLLSGAESGPAMHRKD